MKKVLKVGGIVLVALVLVGAGAILLLRPDPSAEADDVTATAVASRGSIEELVSATGNVVADRQASLAFASSGEIVDVPVIKGQTVEAGDVLARLDTESLEWQITRAEASVASAEARLVQAQKAASEEDLASAQAALDSARANYEKTQEGASAEDLASAQAALDSARANYEKTQEGASAEDLASAQAALDSARANYRKVKAGPTAEDLAAAQAQVDSAIASVQQAQAAYDRIKDRPDAQMRQESLNLQNATIQLEQARANYALQANRPTESELAAAAAQVSQAEATLTTLRDRPSDSELAAAAAQVAQAESSLATLRDRPSDNELAAAAAQVAQAESTLATLQSRPNAEDLAVTQAQLDEAIVGLAQARAQLEDTVLTAPFDGIVVAANVSEGEWANPGAPAFVLAATEPLLLSVNVDEVDVAQLAEGQPAHLSFDAIKDSEVPGTVTYIAPSSTNVGGAVAYAVEIGFEAVDEAGQEIPVRLGMTADVDVVVASAEDALLVPNQAIQADREAGRYFLNRQTSLGVPQRVEVRIGLRDDSFTQILEGLEEGDVVQLPLVPEQIREEQQFGPGGGGFGQGR